MIAPNLSPEFHLNNYFSNLNLSNTSANSKGIGASNVLGLS